MVWVVTLSQGPKSKRVVSVTPIRETSGSKKEKQALKKSCAESLRDSRTTRGPKTERGEAVFVT
jgi:hypothetical protein